MNAPIFVMLLQVHGGERQIEVRFVTQDAVPLPSRSSTITLQSADCPPPAARTRNTLACGVPGKAKKTMVPGSQDERTKMRNTKLTSQTSSLRVPGCRLRKHRSPHGPAKLLSAKPSAKLRASLRGLTAELYKAPR